MADEIGGDPGAEFPANGFSGLCDVIDRNIGRIGHRIAFVHHLQAHGLLYARGLLLGLLGLLLLLLLPRLIDWCLRRAGRLETNFRGDRIPRGFGLVTLAWSCAMLGATALLYAEQRAQALLWLVGCAGFGLLGLLDDTLGTRQIKGLRGHFRAALRDHRITTGLVKAVGGMALALLLAWRFDQAGPAMIVPDAFVIALCANAINLLDLRPGRAGAMFLICAIPVIIFGPHGEQAGVPPLLLVVIPALRVWEADSAGRVMMGDTGSNLLGAALGMAVVTTVGIGGRIAALCGLIALHVVTERRSLTDLIQRNRLLNALDRLTGVR